MALSFQQLVYMALDNAVANGYGQFAHHENVEQVANDLAINDADIEKLLGDDSPAKLIPCIEAWRKHLPPNSFSGTPSYITERNKHGDLQSRKRALPRRRKPL